jgi:hypothetical protein
VPVHERIYRRFEERPKRSKRPGALVVADYASKYARKSKLYWVVLIVGWFPVVILSFIAYSITRPSDMQAMAMQAAADPRRFFDPILLQFAEAQLWFGIFLAATTAAPIIAEDLRRHALELYFSKPLSGFQYVVGKLLAVTQAQVRILVFPYVALCAVGFALFPGSFDACWDLAARGALAGTRYAVVLWFVVSLFTVLAAAVLANATQDARFNLISFRYNLEHVGASLGGLTWKGDEIDATGVPAGPPLSASIAVLGAWGAGAAWLLRRRVRIGVAE